MRPSQPTAFFGGAVSALHELQVRFGEGRLGRPGPLLLVAARGQPVEADARLGVYRLNVFHSWTAALRDTYPVVARLTGDAWFAQTARRYVRCHPSASADIHAFGNELPALLAALPEVVDLGYLQAVLDTTAGFSMPVLVVHGPGKLSVDHLIARRMAR